MHNKKILIVGGGTSGWMCASLLAKSWIKKGFEITLLESKDIGTIGVGEGSTPSIKDFFNALDIEESEWMPACNASYKNGITFSGWSTKPGCESYFHPFYSQLDYMNGDMFLKNADMRRKGIAVDAHPDHFFITSHLTKKHLSPIPNDNFPFDVTYSYHFDAGLLGQFLKTKALAYGAKHKEATVEHVLQHDNGDIKAIQTLEGEQVEADFFVDCTGFRSLLLQKTLKVPFKDFSDHLFNDAAVAMPTELNGPIPAQTLSTAMKHGWSWNIPLTNRFGNGYVYSSRHIDADAAETELRQHLGLMDADVSARHLKMRLGCTEKNWYKNCFAVGLSQGFIEPLEATALHFVAKSIFDFMDSFEQSDFGYRLQDVYNKRILTSFEHVRDYIYLHYLTNSREDTQYWQDVRSQPVLSDSLKSIFEVWHRGDSLLDEIEKQDIGKFYHPLSWYCMLTGVGILPSEAQCQAPSKIHSGADLEKIKQYVERCSLNFTDHKTALARLKMN